MPITARGSMAMFQEGTSDKFYMVAYFDKWTVWHWGRNGSKGQLTVTSTSLTTAARSARDKIWSKVDEGYRFISGLHHSTTKLITIPDAQVGHLMVPNSPNAKQAAGVLRQLIIESSTVDQWRAEAVELPDYAAAIRSLQNLAADLA